MKCFSIFILLLFCSISAVHSQVRISVVVLDEKGVPIPYASIYNRSVNRGVITNNEGRFEMICQTNDAIVIRCMGYQEFKRTAGQLQYAETVTLKQAIFNLDEVIVTPKSIDAVSIVKRFHDNIRRNYPKQTTKINGVYKEYSRVGSEYSGYLQCDIDIHINSIASRSRPDYKTKVNDYALFRNSDDNKKRRYIITDAYYSHFWIYWYDFLWNYKNYKYRHDGYTTYDESELVKIYFQPKRYEKPVRQYKGTMYIDMKTHALVFLHFEMVPYKQDYIFFRGNWQKTIKLDNKIIFGFSDGYYYPTHVIFKATILVKEPVDEDKRLPINKDALTVDFVHNFFTKNVEYNPKGFIGENTPPDQLISNGLLNQSSDYKSDFILETEQEKQLLKK